MSIHEKKALQNKILFDPTFQKRSIHCLKAHGSSCIIYFVNGKSAVITNDLGNILHIINNKKIVCTHRSWAVNLNIPYKFKDKKYGALLHSKGKEIPISKREKPNVLKLLFPENYTVSGKRRTITNRQ